MSTSIGHTFLYNIIILFIVIVFSFLTAIMSYYKAYKVNNRIVSAIEKFEGYNSLSKVEIDNNLTSIGYLRSSGNNNCPSTYKGWARVTMPNEQFNYCIYISDTSPDQGTYYRYGVLTYMNFDFPIIELFKLNVFTRTNNIYKFTDEM